MSNISTTPKPIKFRGTRLEDPLEECHYQRLSSNGRSNLYSLAIPDYNCSEETSNIPLPNLSILAAISDGVYILQENNNVWSTICEPVDAGDEFISLDAYYPESLKDGSFLICYAKANIDTNIYSINFAKLLVKPQEQDPNSSFIEVVARFSLPFDCAALKITHTNYLMTTTEQPSFIVCSSFQSVHLFMQKKGETFEFEEVPLSSIYPELEFLTEVESNIMSLVINTEIDTRHIAVGCQDGTIVCAIKKYNNEENSFETHFNSKTKLYYPISSLVFFDQGEERSLLATCAVNLAVVFNGLDFSNPINLIIPFEEDSVLSAALADVDLDGRQEIILGTYSQHLLIYKNRKGFTLTWKRKFPYPIYGIVNSDFDADGLKELIVLTMYGLHVMKPKLSLARQRILDYLNFVKKNFDLASPPATDP